MNMHMQYNVDARRKKERQVADNIQPRLYHDQHLQQPAASAPLLSRLRNFNNLALTSIGSFFSGPTVAKATTYHHQDLDEGKFSGYGHVVSRGSGWNTNVNRHSDGFSDDPQNCLSSLEDDELTPVGNVYHNPEAVDYFGVKRNPSLRRLGTHDNLDLSDLNVFPSDASALIKNDLPLVQRAGLSHAHILPCRPDVRHLFGDSRCSDRLDKNDIRDTYISAERSSLHDPGQNHLQPKFTSTPERATNTTLCASAAVFVPSSPAARALLSRDKSSMTSFQTIVTGLDTASVHIETPPLTPDSSKSGLLTPASFCTRFEHVDPSYAACTLEYFNGMPGEFRVEGHDNDEILYTSSQLLEVKEGKKREQPVRTKFHLHLSLLFELLNSHAQARQIHYDTSLRPPGLTDALAPVSDDPEEWYGLEYTIELSSRERQPSDTQSFSAGEHSKVWVILTLLALLQFTDSFRQSRESWAAIHRGAIHPFFEDQDYYQWKNWHRLLDKQDERRKHKKGFAFKAHSKDLSRLFVDEMKTRDVLYWQKVWISIF